MQRYNGPGNGDDAGNAIAVDKNGNVYVTGYETTAAGGTEMVTIKVLARFPATAGGRDGVAAGARVARGELRFPGEHGPAELAGPGQHPGGQQRGGAICGHERLQLQPALLRHFAAMKRKKDEG